MLVNRVVVFPDKDTTEYLKRVFNSCPFDIDLDNIFVVLNESKGSAELNPNAVYTASCGSLGYYYDHNTGGTNLVLPLNSQSLLTRMAELRVKDGSVFHANPLAFLVLKQHMPPLHKTYRSFVVSVSEILYNSEQPLVFIGEQQAEFDFADVPDKVYYDETLGV